MQNSYGVAVPNSQIEGSTPIYRHPLAVDGLKGAPEDPSIRTLWDLYLKSVKDYPQSKFHGMRKKGEPFIWQTYAEIHERVINFSSGVKSELKLDITNKYNLLGIMGSNCSELAIAELACIGNSGVTVPMYATTPVETIEYILNQNGCATIVCDETCCSQILKAKPKVPTLQTLICIEKKNIAELRKTAESLTVKLVTFKEIEALGAKNKIEFTTPKPENVFSFIFTSGSTGLPKGALLTHHGQLSVIACSFIDADKANIKFHLGNEYHLSYLPAAHVMERFCGFLMMSIGGAVGYFQGTKELLLDDLKTLRPTFFPSVPRLLNMIHDKIMNTVRKAGGIKEKLFMKALNTKIANLKKRGTVKSVFYDALVFKKVKKSIGLDRCRLMATGSAPIAGNVLDFYRVVLGAYVIEGYGASETCATVTLSHPKNFSTENVGGPLACCEIKLVSIPEMNYLVTDTVHNGNMEVKGRGEICVRGPGIMKEYYRNPEATAKALDKDGWYHTSDVGCILPNGCIKIFDRVGNVFKLSLGEYVQPEKIENICLRSKYVAATFVHGDAFHPKLVAIVVPDPDVAAEWAIQKGIAFPKLKELCTNEDFKKTILEDITQVCKSNTCASFEIPKEIYLESEPFTIDTCLTPTLKMQRKRAIVYYEKQLNEMLGAAS